MPLRPILKPLPPFPESLRGDDSIEKHDFSEQYFPYNPLPFASSSRIPPLESPHVHFPPTPILTRIEMTHSRSSYDRKPILVSPNICALPDRGERDIDYFDVKPQGSNTRSSDLEGGYFSSQPSEPELEGQLERWRVSSASAKFGTRVPSPSSVMRASRVRCILPYHSQRIMNGLPPQPIQGYLEADLNSNRHDVPPPLVFDPSSESESDMCVSPPVDLSLIPGISHISTHFRGGGSSMGRDTHTSFSSLSYEGHNSNGSNAPESMPMHLGKRSRARKHGHKHENEDENKVDSEGCSEGCSEGELDQALGLDAIAGGIIKRARTRTRNAVSSARAGASSCGSGLSSFCEPGLDGCLGGF